MAMAKKKTIKKAEEISMSEIDKYKEDLIAEHYRTLDEADKILGKTK